jgi:hypothetical protein
MIGFPMNKLLTLSLLALVGTPAFAQNSDASSQRSPVFDSKPQLAAARAERSRPAGVVTQTHGDELASAQEAGVGADRAAVRGEQLAQTRSQRHPGHTQHTQGGTPDMADAK